jgi:Peptidase M61 N-terminal domain
MISMVCRKHVSTACLLLMPPFASGEILNKVALIVLGFIVLAITPFAMGESSSIGLDVDATDVAHGIEHAHLVLPVDPGPLTLAYPKWVPGEHAANGPITQLINLHFSTSGHENRWRRDPLDAFSFHIIVPVGTHRLTVDFDYLSLRSGCLPRDSTDLRGRVHLCWLPSRPCPRGRAKFERSHSAP